MNKQVLAEDVRLFAEHFELWERLSGKSFLITGATGLIGSVMVKCLTGLNRLRNLGIKIVAVVRDVDKAIDVLGLEGDTTILKIELNDICQSSIGQKVDYIVHLACPTASKFFVEYPVETLRTSIEGTTSVLEYAKQSGIEAMVFASSLEVYGSNHTDEWITESFQGYVNPTEVRSSYNIGKRACECLCHAYAKEYDVNVIVARMTQTFGAGVGCDDSRVFAQFARKVIEDENIELHSSGETSRMYCYTTDAVSALLYLLIKGEKGISYNVANKESYISIRDMAQLVKKEFNPNISVVFSPKKDKGYAPETKLRMDTSKLEALGWRPMFNLNEMFSRLINFMR